MQLETESINVHLAELLRGHGLVAQPADEWLLVDGTLPALSGMVYTQSQGQYGITRRLDIDAVVSKGRMIRESFAGCGMDPQEATRDALENFCRSSLHVMLAAFWSVVDEDQVSVEQWETAGGNNWHAYLGNFVRRGEAVSIPDDTFEVIEDLVKSLPLSESHHWFRMFYCNVNRSEQISEVLLDNETWSGAEDRIRELPWPSSDEYYSVRLFLILRRPEPARGGA